MRPESELSRSRILHSAERLRQELLRTDVCIDNWSETSKPTPGVLWH